jgi:hypothetical protein
MVTRSENARGAMRDALVFNETAQALRRALRLGLGRVRYDDDEFLPSVAGYHLALPAPRRGA